MNVDMQNAYIAGLASGGVVEQREALNGSEAATTLTMATVSGSATPDDINFTATANAALTE